MGVLAIDDVRRVPVEAVTKEEARMAGYTSLSELRERLEPAREVYRIAFHLAGPDPRITLRNFDRQSAFEAWPGLPACAPVEGRS